MKNEWKEIESIPVNTAVEVKQKNGNISIAAFVNMGSCSGVCKLIEKDGEYLTSNTFLMAVEFWRAK